MITYLTVPYFKSLLFHIPEYSHRKTPLRHHWTQWPIFFNTFHRLKYNIFNNFSTILQGILLIQVQEKNYAVSCFYKCDLIQEEKAKFIGLPNHCYSLIKHIDTLLILKEVIKINIKGNAKTQIRQENQISLSSEFLLVYKFSI